MGQHRPLCNCGLYDDTRDQVYAGWDKEGGPQGSRWVSAVNNTSGQAVLSAGALIQAYYFSSSGGYTENNENVWGGAPLSYLRGVCDPGDYTDQNSSRVWKVGPLTNDAVAGALRPYTGNIGSAVTNFTGYVRGVSGRIISITVVGTQDRQATIAGWQLRAGLGLRDDRVWINANWNVTDGRSGNIRSKYDSIKCAPGLPASRRWSVPGGILQRFAVGTIYWNAGKQPPAASWLHGPVYDKYRALRESGGVLPDGSMLGMPTSDVIRLKPATCSGLTCAMAKFDHGNIYFKEGIGDGSSHELDGFVIGYYIAQGGYSSHLGFPVTDVNLNQQDGSTWAKFEDGTTVTCDSGGNCHESNGPADLSVRISAPRGVKVGTNFRYVLTVANAGPGPAGRVVVNDALPSGVKLLWRKADQGTCTWGRTVTCSIGSMQIGQTVTVTVAVRATASGTLLDAGNVRAKQRDPIPRNNSATVRTIAS